MPSFKKIKEGIFSISWSFHDSITMSAVGRVDNFPNYYCNLVWESSHEYSLKMEIVDPKTSKSVHPVEFKTVWVIRNAGRQYEMVKRNAYFHHPRDPASLIWEAKLYSPFAGVATFDIVIETNSNTLDLTLSRRRLKNIHLAVSHLRENQELGDVVTFKFENQTIIRGHSSILAASSPVFAAMFQHDFKEKKNKIVEITDIHSDVFEQLIQYLYIEDADFQKVDVAELLIAADKYGIDSLKQECDLYLSQNLTVKNVTGYLVLAHFHKASELYEASLNFMASNFKVICSDEENWMKIIKNHPEIAFQVTKCVAANF